jgi:hypothetical protein
LYGYTGDRGPTGYSGATGQTGDTGPTGLISNPFSGDFRIVGNLDIQGDSIICGNMYISSIGSSQLGNLILDGSLSTEGIITAKGVHIPSDPKLKENVQPYLPETMPNVYSFTWKATGLRDIGVLANEVMDIEPACVHVTKDGTKMVDYSKLTVLCFAEIKSLREQIQILTKSIEEWKEALHGSQ